jgi:hypothetical protein
MSKSFKKKRTKQAPEIGSARSASRHTGKQFRTRQTVSNLHDTARRRTFRAGEEPHRRQIAGKTRLPTHGDIGLKEQRDAFNIPYTYLQFGLTTICCSPSFDSTIERRTRREARNHRHEIFYTALSLDSGTPLFKSYRFTYRQTDSETDYFTIDGPTVTLLSDHQPY